MMLLFSSVKKKSWHVWSLSLKPSPARLILSLRFHLLCIVVPIHFRILPFQPLQLPGQLSLIRVRHDLWLKDISINEIMSFHSAQYKLKKYKRN